ncbi:peroxide stress protein YaaA [Comamonas sp. Y33R10-2]|uniref:peroxide stress protein YaaA n=1 Tax=Comamonas sp. Y33R10-2 TaxID=2853257 RepID=UPI001C5CB16B|nr:peroxide stress protein YaaA [Comamonas sp. Y33R10-2]QXZ10070.1 peroxide stress protein YaaA [Comamonas sp. Y33R10-2]
MLFLISPAKSLDYESPVCAELPHTLPVFKKQPLELIEVLREKSPQQISALMSISDKLAVLNVGRYEAFSPKFTAKNSRQAVLAFNGDVYEGLNAASLKPKELDWAQEHVLILSGLYGVLRPLDLLQPYRLEMGTRLENAKGSNLYQFWGSQIADYLNERIKEQPEAERIVVNLASQEYFKSVDLKALKAPVVECAFEDFKGGKYKIISFHAKRARGLMVRWAVQHKAKKVADLRKFDLEGYALAEQASTPSKLVFRRKLD